MREPAKPGPKLSPADVTPVAETVPLYDPGTLRTLFLNFDQPDWEAEMAEFNNTDVEIPATLIVAVLGSLERRPSATEGAAGSSPASCPTTQERCLTGPYTAT